MNDQELEHKLRLLEPLAPPERLDLQVESLIRDADGKRRSSVPSVPWWATVAACLVSALLGALLGAGLGAGPAEEHSDDEPCEVIYVVEEGAALERMVHRPGSRRPRGFFERAHGDIRPLVGP